MAFISNVTYDVIGYIIGELIKRDSPVNVHANDSSARLHDIGQGEASIFDEDSGSGLEFTERDAFNGSYADRARKTGS